MTAINGCASRSRSTATSWIRHIVEGQTVLEYTKPQIGGGAGLTVDPAVKVDGTPLTDGLHLDPGGDRADRLPQDRAAQPRGLHGSEGAQLQEVLHPRGRGGV